MGRFKKDSHIKRSMGMRVFTIGDIRSWEPCYDPDKYLPEDWAGSALDMLANYSKEIVKLAGEYQP